MWLRVYSSYKHEKWVGVAVCVEFQSQEGREKGLLERVG